MAEKKWTRQKSSSLEEENSESIIISRKKWSSILEKIENPESKVEEGEKLNQTQAELAELHARINQLERKVSVEIKTSLEFTQSEVETVQDRVDRCEKEHPIQESKIV